MTRKEHLKITSFHEIGHFLLIERFNKFFPDHLIDVYKIKLYFEDNNPHFGDVFYQKESLNEKDASNEMIEAFICIDLAGFVAPTIFFNITYNADAIKELNDYKSAYYNAYILQERYSKLNIIKTIDEIIEINWSETENYLLEQKDILYTLAKKLYKEHVLSINDINNIKKRI